MDVTMARKSRLSDHGYIHAIYTVIVCLEQRSDEVDHCKRCAARSPQGHW